jgi:hypothetical protein
MLFMLTNEYKAAAVARIGARRALRERSALMGLLRFMAALAICAVTAAMLRDRTDTQAGHAAHWLQWRRRHQARSRWFHQRGRLERNYALVS